VPLLCAYTGARPGEMTQLRSEDVYKKGEGYFARLTPEAGTIKGGQARTTMMARMGVMKVLHRHEVRRFNPNAKDHLWGKAEAEAGSVKETAQPRARLAQRALFILSRRLKCLNVLRGIR